MTNIEAIKRLKLLKVFDAPKLQEAVKMAIAALEKQMGKKPSPDNDILILACHYCGSGEYLHNADENRNLYCGQCGQRIDWSDEHGAD